jgi:hypothetical protein
MLPVSIFANDIDKELDVVAESLEAPFDARISINQELGLIIVSARVAEEKDSSYYEEIDLVDVDFGDQVEPASLPEKPTSATFSHKIYDRSGVLMAAAYVTVKGWYSELDRWSEISSITATFEGEHAHYFSYSSSESGNTGTVSIYFNGIYADSFRYKIDYYGRITQD